MEDREMKFVPVAINEADALLLEVREYQIKEICRVFSGRPIDITTPTSDEAAI